MVLVENVSELLGGKRAVDSEDVILDPGFDDYAVLKARDSNEVVEIALAHKNRCLTLRCVRPDLQEPRPVTVQVGRR